MPDDATLPDDTAPPPDPFEAELVAYLDGELDPAAARKVEERLAGDAAARAKANELRKTFALLDHLPTPEPSPTFASRTLDRLPTVKSGSNPQQPAPAQPAPATATSPSSSVPYVVPTTAVPQPPPPTRWGLWVFGLLIAASVCAATGYLAAEVARPFLFPAPQPTPEDLPISDRRVVENLPLYAAADDLEFVRELATIDFFGDEPNVSADPSVETPTVKPDPPTGEAFDQLAATFKALPPERQQAIRELDRQLHSPEESEDNERLMRVLESYALWLSRLPDDDRTRVLTAESGRRRLDVIQQIRNQQWLDTLPPPRRDELAKLPPTERADRILAWREEERLEREKWAFIPRHVADMNADHPPWPFNDPALREEVIAFMESAYGEPTRRASRLTQLERQRLSLSLAQAREKGGWLAWYVYGRAVNDTVRKYELLPEPADSEPVTTVAQLDKAARWFEKGKGVGAVRQHVGKWPDFALAVHGYLTSGKANKIALPQLGPARPREFREPLRAFVTETLTPVLTPAEQKRLESLLGKWPDYPREMIRLARKHDLVVPGIMPPGSPRRWQGMYGPFPGKRP